MHRPREKGRVVESDCALRVLQTLLLYTNEWLAHRRIVEYIRTIYKERYTEPMMDQVYASLAFSGYTIRQHGKGEPTYRITQKGIARLQEIGTLGLPLARKLPKMSAKGP